MPWRGYLSTPCTLEGHARPARAVTVWEPGGADLGRGFCLGKRPNPKKAPHILHGCPTPHCALATRMADGNRFAQSHLHEVLSSKVFFKGNWASMDEFTFPMTEGLLSPSRPF